MERTRNSETDENKESIGKGRKGERDEGSLISQIMNRRGKERFPVFDPVAKDAGIYLMAFEDFHHYFDTVSICVPIIPLISSEFIIPKDSPIGYKVKKVKWTLLVC